MTNSEYKLKISESQDVNYLNTITVNFNFNYINFNKNITGITALYEFINKQLEGWSEITLQNDSNFIRVSKNYFENLRNQLIQLANTNSVPQQRNILSNILSAVPVNRDNPILFDIPETKFLLKVLNEYPKSINGAVNFIIGTPNVNDRNNLIGSILAYEFTLKGKSEITKRSKEEEVHILKLRTDFEKYTSESETQLINHLRNYKEKYEEYSKKIDITKEEKEQLFNHWLDTTKKDFFAFSEKSKKEISTLESSYEELLSLKKPTEYWNKRALQLNKEGKNYSILLSILVAISCSCLYFLLWKTPEGLLKSFFGNDKSIAIRWSILFVTFISFMAYFINAVTKMLFSSFHLARDAEEREQLTFVYLALLKESSISKEDRILILQSLFSRADTGLLKMDSSPSMPGSSAIFDKIIKS